MIDISDSDFVIKDTKIDENINNLILLTRSNFSCANTSFLNHSCMLNSQGCILSASENSYIRISSSSFENILSLSENNIYLFSSNAILQNTSFKFVRTQKNKGNIIGSIQSFISILNGVMSNYEGNALYLEEGTIVIDNIKLLDNLFNKRGLSPIILINCAYFKLRNVRLENNSYSDQGGAISMINTLQLFFKQEENIITNSIFSFNKANKGGAIYLKNQNVSVINSTFISNKADNGGAIFCELDGNHEFVHYFWLLFFSLLGTFQAQAIISENNFTNNYASIDGGGIKWTGLQPFFSKIFYKLNTGQYGNNIASYPIKMELEIFENFENTSKLVYSSKENDSLLSLCEINPGNKIQYKIDFSLLDIYEQIVLTQKG